MASPPPGAGRCSRSSPRTSTAVLRLADLVARLVQAVERLALVVEPRLARVEVLGPVVALEQPAAERDGAALGGADGDDQPAAEQVVVALASNVAMFGGVYVVAWLIWCC